MDGIVQKTTSHGQEVKETAEVLRQDKAIRREGNLGIEAYANKIQFLSDTENIRFRYGRDIVDKKNQIIKLDRFRYSVKSQSSRGEYEVISTELGWTCSCADHKFRNTICKHIFAIFGILELEQEASIQDSTESIPTYRDRSIAGEDCNERLEAAWTINRSGEPVEVYQEPLPEEAYQSLPSGRTAADYEQELYEKDRYIEGLESEIRGLKCLTHSSREETL